MGKKEKPNLNQSTLTKQHNLKRCHDRYENKMIAKRSQI